MRAITCTLSHKRDLGLDGDIIDRHYANDTDETQRRRAWGS